MDELDDGSVALVVTSPPYFAGKHYEEELEKEGVPSSYIEYLELLHDVFAECVRKLEPGGRIAVNVANLGRKPYRSLSADVIAILQDRLGLLLRGEIIWQKGEGASGSCAWGSFRSPANPVLRDLTERVVIASKGRFDRHREASHRVPRATLTTGTHVATLDVGIAPERRASAVPHRAAGSCAVHLRRHSFLDPFMGSGTALSRQHAGPPVRRLRPRPDVRRHRPATCGARRHARRGECARRSGEGCSSPRKCSSMRASRSRRYRVSPHRIW